MSEFEFETDDEGLKFAKAIAYSMTVMFAISCKEAVGRINRDWKGRTLFKDDLVFHETPEYWANQFFYGFDSHWWKWPPNLRPRPFP